MVFSKPYPDMNEFFSSKIMQKSESEEAMSARIWLDVNIMGNEKQKRWHWPAALRNYALARKRDIKLKVKVKVKPEYEH